MSAAYEAIAWLKPECDFDLARAAALVKEWLPDAKLSGGTHDIKITLGGWDLWLHLNERPYVLDEAREFATLRPDSARHQEIAQCKRRVEVYCPQDDHAMSHFNDFVFVCQALEEFQGLILCDPRSGELI